MENFNFGELLTDALKKMGKANIIITGKTGVGKSTLINSIFNNNLITTGVVKPITKDIREYNKDDSSVALIDTRGLELDNYKNILVDLKNEIKKRETKNAESHIHIAWYCINNNSRRFEDCELEFIKELSQKIRVVIVLTQCIDMNEDFFNAVKTYTYGLDCQVIKVLAQPFETSLGLIPSCGLDNLVSHTIEVLPDAQKNAFARAQNICNELKTKRAYGVVAISASAAATAGAVPIPFSDTAVLAPIQIGMLTSISLIMGLDVNKAFITTLVTSAAGIVGASYAGRAIVSGMLKLIPIAGSLIGGSISAVTAGALTTIMGTAFIEAINLTIQKDEKFTAESLSKNFTMLLMNGKQ